MDVDVVPREMPPDTLPGEPPLCANCGRPLSGDPDEDPTGDADQPICGECERSRDWFAIDAADGSVDDDWDSANR